jgi:hypothetical protein
VAGVGATDLEGGRGGDSEGGGVRDNGEQLVDGEPQRERDERLRLRLPLPLLRWRQGQGQRPTCEFPYLAAPHPIDFIIARLESRVMGMC